MSDYIEQTGWHPWRVGDTAFAPITNHPKFPIVMRVDSYAKFRDRETAQRIADAWNGYGGEWTWYVKEFELLPALNSEYDLGEDLNQYSFW